MRVFSCPSAKTTHFFVFLPLGNEKHRVYGPLARKHRIFSVKKTLNYCKTGTLNLNRGEMVVPRAVPTVGALECGSVESQVDP